MRIYWELTNLAIKKQLAYRAAAAAGVATNFFFGLLRVAVLVALYGARQEVSGMTVQVAVTFTGISQAVIAYLSLFGWFEIIRSVHAGAVGADLLKPIGYFRYWMAQDFGRAIVQLFLRGLPIMLLYAVVFDITYPTSLWQWLALAAALVLGWLVSFSFRFLINLSAFWVPNAVGIARAAYTASWFLSGFLMPLRFLPDWFVQLSYLTPFPHMVTSVIEIYLGLLSPREVAAALANQVIWAAMLIGIGQIVLQLGVRKLVVQGG
jgi:ABC-2 type transport system permease protein